jgi:hypothetical protein
MKKLILLAALLLSACGTETKKEVIEPLPPVKAINIELGVDDYNSLKYLLEHISVINMYGVKITYYVSGYNESIKDDLLYLQSMGHEIANHTQNHYYAPTYVNQNSVDSYIENVMTYNQKLVYDGIEINKFAYPFGAGTPELDAELIKQFDHVRYTTKDYTVVGGGKFPKAINIDGYNLDTDKMRQAIDLAESKGENVYFLFHAITENYGDGFYITPTELIEILEVVAEYN